MNAARKELRDILFYGCDESDTAAELALSALRGFVLDVEGLSAAACDDAGVVEQLLPRLEARMNAAIRVLEEKMKSDAAIETIAKCNAALAE